MKRSEVFRDLSREAADLAGRASELFDKLGDEHLPSFANDADDAHATLARLSAELKACAKVFGDAGEKARRDAGLQV